MARGPGGLQKQSAYTCYIRQLKHLQRLRKAFRQLRVASKRDQGKFSKACKMRRECKELLRHREQEYRAAIQREAPHEELLRYATQLQEASDNYVAKRLGAQQVKERARVTSLTKVVACQGLLKAQRGALDRLEWWRTVGLHRTCHIVCRAPVSEPTSEAQSEEADVEEPDDEPMPLLSETAQDDDTIHKGLCAREGDCIDEAHGQAPEVTTVTGMEESKGDQGKDVAGEELKDTGKRHTSDEGDIRRDDSAKVLWPKLCTAIKAGQPRRPEPRLIVPKVKAAMPHEVQRKEKAASAAEPAAGGLVRMLRPLPKPLPKGSAATCLAQARAAAAAATAEVAVRHELGTVRGRTDPNKRHGAGRPGHALPLPPPPPWPAGSGSATCTERWL